MPRPRRSAAVRSLPGHVPREPLPPPAPVDTMDAGYDAAHLLAPALPATRLLGLVLFSDQSVVVRRVGRYNNHARCPVAGSGKLYGDDAGRGHAVGLGHGNADLCDP